MSFYFRSHATDLSDNGLLLLDVLFDHGGTSCRLLRAVNFRPQWNLPFAHNLSDDELMELLQAYEKRGLITISDGVETFCAITPIGGALWEAERQPRWDRYAFGRENSKMKSDPEQISHAVIVSYFRSSAAAEEYVGNCQTLGLNLAENGRMRRRISRKLRGVVEWKRFESWDVVAFLVRDCDANDREQKYSPLSAYDKVSIAQRCTLTWHSVCELQRFL